MEEKEINNDLKFNSFNNRDSKDKKDGKVFKSVNVSLNKEKYRINRKDLTKEIIIPMISGVVGAGIVLGTCFGIPTVKRKIVGGNGLYNTQINKSVGEATDKLISLEEYSGTAVGVADKILPSIVGITVEYSVNSIFMMQSTTAQAEGSGIIISSDGYILTNNHVINSSSSSSFYEIGQATKVEVYLYNDKNPHVATVIGTDAETDLAVIKIEEENLTAAELGDSDMLQVGEFVMAAGNPLGMESSVTSGIVSAIDREVTDSEGKVYRLIQTDAAINSGNSGGALVNSEGKVIGINTLKVSQTGVEGMGFAIPINSAEPIYEQLIQYKKVKRPFIGISGRDIDESLARRYDLVEGIYISSITEFSGAERAGLQIGDIVIKVDGQEVKTMSELNNIKNTHQIGEELVLTINREGKEKEVTVKLGEQ